MISIRCWTTGLVAVLLVGLCLPVSTVAGGIIEGPDPVGSPANGGEGEAARAPEEAPRTGGGSGARAPEGANAPIIVWAEDVGGDHDIRFSETRGRLWKERAEFLSSSPADELDPRGFVDESGAVYVVWWENETPQSVVLIRRDAGSESWHAPLVVTQAGRRPAIAVVADEILIAFERDGLFAGEQEIVVASLGPAGRDFRTVATSGLSGRLDLRLMVDDGVVTARWKDATGGFVTSERVGAEWTGPVVATPAP